MYKNLYKRGTTLEPFGRAYYIYVVHFMSYVATFIHMTWTLLQEFETQTFEYTASLLLY